MFASRRLVTIVKVKQEAAHVFVIDLASAVCFILGNDLAGKNRNIILEENITLREKHIYIYTHTSHLPTVLGDELVLLNRLFDEDSPPGHIRRSQ